MAGRTLIRFVVVTDPRIEIGRVRVEEGRLIYSGDIETVRGVISQTARRHDVTPVKAFDIILQEGWGNAYLQTVRTEGVAT